MSLISNYLDCELPIALKCFSNRDAWEASESWLGGDVRYITETALAQRLRDTGVISGYCWLCAKRTDFTFKAGAEHSMPHWREQLSCTGCGLICRTRLGLMLAIGFLKGTGTDRPYITEQVTQAYRQLKHLYPKTIGSEYVADGALRYPLACISDELPSGAAESVHHEDVTQLSLASASVDVVLSFEVLEHVPDYRTALREFQRVLRPGGLLVVSVPFLPLLHDNDIRAVRHADGSIQHLLEPEYHGDPIADAGCLAYYNFGWAILDDMRAAGFDRAGLVDAWSPPSGILSGPLGMFLARKPSPGLKNHEHDNGAVAD